METLFNDLLEQYRQFRTFAAWYELSASEIKSFVENMRVRLIRLQAEHQDFPARVVDCEISAFESIADTNRESAAEGHKYEMTFCSVGADDPAGRS